jgi:hypothetical protein
VAYEEITLDAMPPREKPDDEDPSPPKGPVVVPDDAEEDPPRSPLRIPESPDVDDADELGDARLCSVVGTVEISCDNVDCAPVPVDVPTAWAPAAACAASPPGLVVCGAAVNDVILAVAAADFAA